MQICSKYYVSWAITVCASFELDSSRFRMSSADCKAYEESSVMLAYNFTIFLWIELATLMLKTLGSSK